MSEWYRHEDWNEAIAVDFETRLARSRSQRAQYLSLQGYHFVRAHPATACELLERAVALGDECETARALGYLAMARLARDDVEGALDAYEQALEYQLDHPGIIAVQPVDYVFLIGPFERRERLALATEIVAALPDEGLFGPDAQTFTAKALVYQIAGRLTDARRYAVLALPLMEHMPDVAALGIDIADLRRRLSDLADRN